MTDINPFQFGALALDEAFTDREAEIAELRSDVRNGQDVVVFAPRRYGKSSLVWRASQELLREKVLVASVDLMTTPTPAKLAEKLARAIHDDVASPLLRAKERLRIFGDLKVTPTITVDAQTGAPSFSFSVTERAEDIDATIERLLELPGELGADRKRQVALVLDEFQEVIDIDPRLPRLMRAVFQQQPEVAHVYLGSKRHMLRRLFSDENEPFWRSAKQMELGVIEAEAFAPFIARQFERTGRFVSAEAVDAILEITAGHPYATQELCYFAWQEIGPRSARSRRTSRRRWPGSCAPSTPTSRCCGSARRPCSGSCWSSWHASRGGRCRPTTATGTTCRGRRPCSARSRRWSAGSSWRATGGSCGSSSRSSPPGCCVI